ncbi:MAG: hypothetical protein ACJAYF_001284 [Arenicella sp.]|jgi:hypothetical protein
MKMSAMPPLFVEKLANSSLLAALSASIGDIPTYFYFVPELC